MFKASKLILCPLSQKIITNTDCNIFKTQFYTIETTFCDICKNVWYKFPTNNKIYRLKVSNNDIKILKQNISFIC